jgi:hypothetical protein
MPLLRHPNIETLEYQEGKCPGGLAAAAEAELPEPAWRVWEWEL